eukprot:scaffold12479_cov51-Phaeocystis_antarctica.AAC.4
MVARWYRKNKGGETTTRTEIETGKDLGFCGFGPWEPAAAKQHLTLAKGRTRHPQPLQPSRAPERKVQTASLSAEICGGLASGLRSCIASLKTDYI